MADGVNGQDLQNVIVTIHPFFDLYGVNSFQIPQGVAFLNPGDNISRPRNNGFSFFAQDDWRIIPSLTLSGGLRYDYDTRFDAKRNLAPRLGLAWSPDKKTVFRASWGLFFDRYRLGIAQTVPQLGGFNGKTVVELDYPRLANDALIPFPGSIAAFAAMLGDPNFLNTQFSITPGSLVTSGNIQSLTGMAPADFVTAVNTYLGTFGVPFTPVDFSPSTGFLRNDITGNFEDEIRVSSPFRTPYNNTFTVGVERQLTSTLSVGATYRAPEHSGHPWRSNHEPVAGVRGSRHSDHDGRRTDPAKLWAVVRRKIQWIGSDAQYAVLAPFPISSELHLRLKYGRPLELELGPGRGRARRRGGSDEQQ